MEKLVILACIAGFAFLWYKMVVRWCLYHIEFEELKEGDTNECDN